MWDDEKRIAKEIVDLLKIEFKDKKWGEDVLDKISIGDKKMKRKKDFKLSGELDIEDMVLMNFENKD